MLPAEPRRDTSYPVGDGTMLTRAELLAHPRLRTTLVRLVRRRVPASEVDDIVQASLAEALASSTAPSAEAEVERWICGIARHKCADFYRRARREAPSPETIELAASTDNERQAAEEWLHWAHRELPPGEHAESTLEWMLREASGEKLESIAADEQVPAPRVRQRVVRMRKHFRARWATQLAAIVAAIALVILGALILRGRKPHEARRIEPERITPMREAAELRRIALDQCRRGEWQRCVHNLDAAKALDDEGELIPEVRSAREAAGRAMAPPVPEAPQSVPTAESPRQVPSAVPRAVPSSRGLDPSSAQPKTSNGPPQGKWAPNQESDLSSDEKVKPSSRPLDVAPPTPTQTPPPKPQAPQTNSKKADPAFLYGQSEK